ncbi:MAG: tRNA lysidine(34) synthetase TilS [Hydrogenibacillus sp.]|nr:tRNA lysidine(34) synthetase TilS [Hydrogenibacillus sp.]
MKAFVPDASLFQPGEKVVAAVSGGADSMALMEWLYEEHTKLGIAVFVVHVHHGLRGEEADEDARFVERAAAERGFPFRLVRLTGEGADPPRANVEALLRRRRYEALVSAARRHQAEKIAVAHHADDQRETVLLKLLRGTSPMGLAGMPRRRRLSPGIELVRPFIALERRAIIDYLQARGVAYRHDRTNDDPRFLRNRVRNELMPLFIALSPSFPRRLDVLIAQARAEAAYWEGAARDLLATLQPIGGAWRWPVGDFLARPLPLQRRAIHLIWSCLQAPHAAPDDDAALDLTHIEALRSMLIARRPAALDLPGHYRVVLFGTDLYFLPKSRGTEGFALVPPAMLVWPERRERYRFLVVRPEAVLGAELGRTAHRRGEMADRRVIGPAPANPSRAMFDRDALLSFAGGRPLMVRLRRPGDVFWHSLERREKLKDVLARTALARPVRRQIAVFAVGRDVLWVPGVIASQAFLPRPGRAAIECRYEVDDPGGTGCD